MATTGGASGAAFVQAQDLPEWARAERSVERHAFVLGISQYQALNAVDAAEYDARAIKLALGRLSFGNIVRPEGDLSRDGILRHFRLFLDRVQPGDTVVFYFSGHGFERGGINYIAPADLDELPDNRIGMVALSLDYFMRALGERGAGLTFFFLDACRTDTVPIGLPGAKPVSGLLGAKNGPAGAKQANGLAIENTGFAAVSGPPNTTIMFAAAPRRASFSRLEGDAADSPSVFTRALVRSLGETDAPFHELWTDIADGVRRTTDDRQEPWISNKGGYALGLVLDQSDAYRARAAREWSVAAAAPAESQTALLRRFLKRHPDSAHGAAAQMRLAALQAEAPVGTTAIQKR